MLDKVARRHLRHVLRRLLSGDGDSCGIPRSSPPPRRRRRSPTWAHYDSIYTERYMWIPQENKEGYDAGSAMTLREGS